MSTSRGQEYLVLSSNGHYAVEPKKRPSSACYFISIFEASPHALRAYSQISSTGFIVGLSLYFFNNPGRLCLRYPSGEIGDV